MRAWGAALCVALVALVACTDDSGDDVRSRLRHAAEATMESGSARVATSIDLEDEDVAPDLRINGQIDFDGDAEITSDNGITSDMTQRRVDGVIYLSLSFLGIPAESDSDSPFPNGVRWVSIDLDDDAGIPGFDLAELELADTQHDRPAFAALRGIVRAQRAGTAEVRDSQTTVFRATIDPDKARQALPSDAPAYVETAMDQLGDERVDALIWLDEDDRLRKLVLDLEAFEPFPGEESPTRITTEYYDFGLDVDVEAPPDDETISIEEFTELLEGGVASGGVDLAD